MQVSSPPSAVRRRDDRAAGDDEAGAAALHLQAVDHVLDGPVVAARVPGAVHVRVEPVLVDQVPVQVPQRGGPAVAEPVRERERGPVQPPVRLDAVVGERLDRHVARVGARADAGAVAVVLEEHVRAHAARLVRVVQCRVERERDREVVAPSLARLLVAGEAVHGLRTAREAVGDAVPVLVDDDPAVEVAVAYRRLAGPEVHLHPRAAAVRGGGGEVGVVRAASVLRLRLDVVAADAAAAVVVHLEVPRRLVEPVAVQDVVDDVVPVEEVGDGRVPIVVRVLGQEVDREVEVETRPALRLGRVRLGDALDAPRRRKTGLDRVPVVERDHDRRDDDRWIRAAHGDRCPCHVVDHDHGSGAGVLSVLHLDGEVAAAAVDERNRPRRQRERLAAVRGRPDPVVDHRERPRDARLGGPRTELRDCGVVRAGRGRWRVDDHNWEAARRSVVVVVVCVRVRVVAARGRELGTDDAIGVVPAERRRDRVGRIAFQRARPVVRALLWQREDPVARTVDHRVRRRDDRAARAERRAGCRVAGAAEPALEAGPGVVRGPVGRVEQLAGRGIHRRVPEMRAGGVVDRELPGQAQPLRGGLPAQPSRDRLVRDPAAGDDRLLGGAAALAEDTQARRIREVERVGRRLDRLGRVGVRVG